MNKLKLALLGLVLSATAIGGLSFSTASALPNVTAASISTQSACEGLNQIDTAQSCGSGKGESSITSIIRTVITILSYLVGIVSVIMIIIAGFKYVTSGGDSNRVGSAKSTLLYALVGLVIVALAQLLVHYVISAAVNPK